MAFRILPDTFGPAPRHRNDRARHGTWGFRSFHPARLAAARFPRPGLASAAQRHAPGEHAVRRPARLHALQASATLPGVQTPVMTSPRTPASATTSRQAGGCQHQGRRTGADGGDGGRHTAPDGRLRGAVESHAAEQSRAGPDLITEHFAEALLESADLGGETGAAGVGRREVTWRSVTSPP
jgi:hypothetical protein